MVKCILPLILALACGCAGGGHNQGLRGDGGDFEGGGARARLDYRRMRGAGRRAAENRGGQIVS